MTSVLEREEERWRNGRLVVRRPEVPDSDLADMTVIRTRAEHFALNEIVYELVEQLRDEDATQSPR